LYNWNVAIYFLVIKKKKENTRDDTESTDPKDTPPPTPKESKIVTMNDGSVSCERYCLGKYKKPWNNELPENWNGAKCVESSTIPCTSVTKFPINCTCEKMD